jgi:hypothetical protein
MNSGIPMTGPSKHFDRRGFLRGACAAVAVPCIMTNTASGQAPSPVLCSENCGPREDTMTTRSIEYPQTRCLAGVARADITPPVGIYHRMWGAAVHDRSTGVHRPLTATVLYLENLAGAATASDVRVLVAVDHCLLGQTEMGNLLDHLVADTGIAREAIVVFFSHTHGAGLMGLDRQTLPGGELIPGYLQDLADTIARLINGAREGKTPATIGYGQGCCNLAANRDFFDADRDLPVCGFNPAGPADDTVRVAAIRDERNEPLATVVAYACHPTTLAWENTLISPDYVGAMREVVERATEAPCFFVQGASGDLGPREGFVGDVQVADSNGRQLGHAALAALEAIPAGGLRYDYVGPVVSGATLGIWEYASVGATRQAESAVWDVRLLTVPLAYRKDRPEREALQREQRLWQQREDEAREAGDEHGMRDARAMVERQTRALSRISHLPAGEVFPFPVGLWRLGDAVWVAVGGEHYHKLQRELRRRFPGTPVMVGTLANGSNVWYVLDAESYGRGLYQESVSILAQGSLERLIDAIAEEIVRMGFQQAADCQ